MTYIFYVECTIVNKRGEECCCFLTCVCLKWESGTYRAKMKSGEVEPRGVATTSSSMDSPSSKEETDPGHGDAGPVATWKDGDRIHSYLT